MAQTYAAQSSRQPLHDRQEPGTEASFADLARALRARWRYVVVPTLIAFLAALVFVNVVSPRYTGEAKLLLQTGDTYFTRPNSDRNADQAQQIDEQAVASQVQVVMSRDLAREAIRRMGLVGNPEFDRAAGGPGLLRRLAAFVGLARSEDGPPEDRVLDEFNDHLLVYPVGKSRIVSIEFRSRDADLAANTANMVAELYLGRQEDAKKDLARSASTWLGTNIDDLRKRVADSEAKVEQFRSKSGLLSGSGTTTISAQQLSDLSGQLAQARTAQSDSQVKAQMIRDLNRDGRAFEIPDVANNELIRRLIEQRINLRAQLALELRTLLPQHPRIKELNAQLGDLEGQIRGAAERTARTLENDAKIAGSRVQSLEAAIDQQKKVVSQANEGEVQLRALEREARAQRDQLESYLTRFREASARDTGNAAPPDARIVSRAVAPQIPSFPKKLPIVALATFAALVLSAGIVIARELMGSASARPSPSFDPGRVRPSDLPERRDGDQTWTTGQRFDMRAPGSSQAALASPAPMPAPMPAVQLATEQRMAPPDPDPRYEFADLVDRLHRVDVAGRARRILVAAVRGGAEAADVGRGLALALARDHRVIVVEIDPERSADPGMPGLTDLVAGEASFADVIYREPGSRLHRISIGTHRDTPLAQQPEGFDVVLSALDQTYDWIVCMLFSDRGDALMTLLGSRVDAVVIASNLEPAHPDLIEAYGTARDSGVAEVVVAREQSVPEANSAAA